MSNQPSTWADYDTAYDAFYKFGGNGFGFFLGGGYAGIDIDDCIDDNGNISDMAAKVIDCMNTYTEISPGRHGVHMLFRVSEDFALEGKQNTRNDTLGLEIYYKTQYLTVTGNILGVLKPINLRENELIEVYREYFIKSDNDMPKKQPENVSTEKNASGITGDESDAALWDYMFNSLSNGAAIKALYNGDIACYGNDESRADLALCNYLVYYTNHDAARVDRLFRQSGLMRGKWDEMRGTQSYGALTIAKAINDVTRRNDTLSVISSINDTYHVDDTTRTNDTPTTGGVKWQYNPDNYNPDARYDTQPGHDTPKTDNDTPQPESDQNEDSVHSGSEKQSSSFHSVLGYLNHSLEGDLERVKTYHNRKTGFTNIDKQTSLFPGLYVIGSLTGGGKTTLCWQMANNLASKGEHVLYFSLEQTELELVTKGLARITALEVLEKNGADALKKYTFTDAITAINIRKGVKTLALQRAIETYKKYADRLYVISCSFSMDAVQMISIVEKYIAQFGVKPVVFIDYLQIVKPSTNAARMPRRDAIDDCVQRFKKLSAEAEISIFLISSLNRQNYLSVIDFESFKESGLIEYSADVVWGLQLQAMNAAIFDSDKGLQAKRKFVQHAQQATPRKIELIGLKNRYGRPGMRFYFDYFPAFDTFLPDEKDAEDVAEEMTLEYERFEATFEAQNTGEARSKYKGKNKPQDLGR